MMYKLYIHPPEGISACRQEGEACPKPASAARTRSLPPVSEARQELSHESLGEKQDVHVQTRCTCTSSSSNSLSHKHNNEEKKKEKATANATASWLVKNPWVLSSIPQCGFFHLVTTDMVGCSR